MTTFDHKKIEEKWNKAWEKQGTYKVDLKKAKKPFYNLMMFPYPSAEGLHVGNMYAFTGADFYGRYKAMQGYDVFEPIGLDGFGIHSENYAIKIGKHPKEQAKISEKRFYEQLAKIGNRFNWDNRLETYDPEYYKWTQWLFIKMFENGLAYRKKSLVNWCPSCKTVLSDEQVEGGLCERCKTETEKKETYQWFLKITDYAQRLLDNIDKIDWPEKIKAAQRNWIGRKEGVDIEYRIREGLEREGSELARLSSGSQQVAGSSEPTRTDLIVNCFTTRPDTNFGATFVVLGPEHELVSKMIKGEIKVKDKVAVEEYVKKALKRSEIERIAEGRKKTGVDTGLKAINDLTGREMPIFITDFVLGHVGTGAVVGVPGHDKRDFEFAKEFGLDVIRVVVASDGDESEIIKVEQVQEDEGKMINSKFLNGMDVKKAIEKMMDYLEEKKMGKRVVNFRLRDWCISRQRYWGPPIPMIYCEKCAKRATQNHTPGVKEVHTPGVVGNMAGWYPEKLENLPVELPDVKDFKPTGDGKSPLEKASKDWLYT
ncbi:class I tRNA ligase family protein, partial [Patescibacteria group bacterium]|nr:class I tRNA ligase family protein [Patescibacteria group bacterium]